MKQVTKHASKAASRGGRPSKEDAGKIEDKILDAAASLFFTEGYGAVSIEQIAKRARISKRTFYARYADKAALFRAVVHRVIERLRPSQPATDALFKGMSTEEVLRRIAPIILKAAMSPEAVAMQRIMISQAARFPELAEIMSREGARQEAITRIAAILRQDAGTQKIDAEFMAEQFLFLLTGGPQRRAMGLGEPLSPAELDTWAQASVDLFLKGCRAA